MRVGVEEVEFQTPLLLLEVRGGSRGAQRAMAAPPTRHLRLVAVVVQPHQRQVEFVRVVQHLALRACPSRELPRYLHLGWEAEVCKGRALRSL